jgi:adenosine deaminase
MQNLQYLELMATPGGEALARVSAGATGSDPPEQLLERLKPLLAAYVAAARQDLDEWDEQVARAAALTPPLSAADRPLTVRYQVTAYRTAPDAQVFATFAAGFALMAADRRVVGVNLAAPEDAPLAISHFDAQMRGLDFLWKQFDRPNISLHAGELNLLLAPLEDLTFHIRRSIELGHARRIGHGTAIAWEDDAAGLLRRMRAQRVAVEICPTSEAVIQSAEGNRHPFRLYRRAGVPLTLNTDDEGVLRSNLTLEFVRAARSWGLSYPDLKELARNSLEYSFLPGASLFEQHDYRRPRAEFRALAARGWRATATERPALATSDRAVVQARLERALIEFEQGFGPGGAGGAGGG